MLTPAAPSAVLDGFFNDFAGFFSIDEDADGRFMGSAQPFRTLLGSNGLWSPNKGKNKQQITTTELIENLVEPKPEKTNFCETSLYIYE